MLKCAVQVMRWRDTRALYRPLVTSRQFTSLTYFFYNILFNTTTIPIYSVLQPRNTIQTYSPIGLYHITPCNTNHIPKSTRYHYQHTQHSTLVIVQLMNVTFPLKSIEARYTFATRIFQVTLSFSLTFPWHVYQMISVIIRIFI